ncbi:hypothetical protein ACFLZH_01600 [Patescibacteria group bacterium]
MKVCKNCKVNFKVDEEDEKFLKKLSPTIGDKKIQIPKPTFCPDCRQQRRLTFRNEHNLYKRKCDLCSKEIVSCFHKNAPCPVYCYECWWSDKWDAIDFGQDIDFSRGFFEQFQELKNKVPQVALQASNNENSDYVNMSGYNKNCYLLFAAEFDEDCLYGTQVIKCNDCVDNLNCTESEYCYENVDIAKCYSVMFSQNSRNCNESMFLYDCRSCNNCLFCTNLRNKKYYVFNKEVSKEEYFEKRKEIMEMLEKEGLETLLEQFKKLKSQAIFKNLEVQNNENSFGNYLYDSKNVKNCFDLSYAEDCRYVYTGFQAKDLMDVSHTTDAEIGYDSTSLGYNSNNILFTYLSWGCADGMYFDHCHTSSNIFGCVGIRKKKHCILNKQYSQAEYEELVVKLIDHMREKGEWGEFFPSKLSPYAYNETTAYMYFPLTKEQAEAQGYRWLDPDSTEYQKPHNDILGCEDCKKNYKLVAQEESFYKKFGLPTPKKCPLCRLMRRFESRPKRKLFNDNCDKCDAKIKTTYSPDRPEKVYCEQCYLNEIV